MSYRARLIAFHLPQFHQIPENDAWWGEGFTEWTNVRRAYPRYKDHQQPKIPTDLGYYDLSLAKDREKQAELARSAGIEGFCFWHYWFNGKMLLEKPIVEMLKSGKPDIKFCLAWANEPWSRNWDGAFHEVLQAQEYGGDADDRRHFNWLLPALKDPRAITIDGKPVFLIYKARKMPDCRRTTELWRQLAWENGLPGLYLMSIETEGTYGWDPRDGGFDAAVEFQPYWQRIVDYFKKRPWLRLSNQIRYGNELRKVDYASIWPHLVSPEREYPLYRSVCPGWDNTPRRKKGAFLFENSTPQEFSKWLTRTIDLMSNKPEDHRIVFINAWNEWAEGNYLEPDTKYGRAYLEETLKAIK